MAGKYLFDQRSTRTGQAENENRPARIASPPGGSLEKTRAEGGQGTVNEALVVRGIISALLAAGQFPVQGVGLVQAVGGAGEAISSVQDLGETEQQPGAGPIP